MSTETRPTDAKRARKEASLTVRVTRETKESMEAEAARQGRSLSQVAERWLDAARDGRADLQGRLGGGGIAEALLALADYADLVKANIGDPQKDMAARDGLLEGWSEIIARALPFTPASQDVIEASVAEKNAQALLLGLQDAVLAVEDNGEQANWMVATRSQPKPGSAETGRPLLLLMMDYRRGLLDGEGVASMIAILRQAPENVAALSPSPGVVANALEDASVKKLIAMATRAEAQRKAQALVRIMAAAGAIQ